jgi:hypothetical protein
VVKIQPLGGPWSSKTPTVVVSGLPRSGTSMMMQMLQAGGVPVLTDGERRADEDNPRGYFEFEKVKQTKRDATWLDGSDGKVVKVIHALIRDLPGNRPYRVVFMRRRIEEVLESQAAMLARLGKDGAALPPAKLAAIFERQVEEVLRYMSEQHCFGVLEVWYNEVLGQPLDQAQAIDRFLSGQMDTQAMASAVDPALNRQRP